MLAPRSCFDSVALSSCLFLILSVGASGQEHPDSTASEAGRVPDEIGADDWSSLRDAYEAGRHTAEATEDGYEARNPGQGWSLSFDSRGFLVEPDANAWSWGLELVSYGFAGRAQFVGNSACSSAEGGHVTHSWDDNLDEWFVNDTRGFEHGFTLQERPGSMAPEERGPLTLQLGVRGGLTPVVGDSRRSVSFVDEHGSIALTYSGLVVFDANGDRFPAWFELGDSGLKLSVDERDATYPLTIDPVAQQAYLKASNTDADDGFGYAVAISGDTVVVGAPNERSNAVGIDGDQTNNASLWSGAVYVFRKRGSVWSQEAYLKASNTDPNDYFGKSLAISGDTVVVGADNESSDAVGIDGDQANNASIRSGAAYVFKRSGSVWIQEAYLKASNTDSEDLFGRSLAISGDTVVVGATGESSNAIGIDGDQANNASSLSGAAYVFTRSGSVWSQQAYLKASNTDGLDRFGTSVAISGDSLVVGARSESSDAIGVDGDQTSNSVLGAGAVYVFTRSGSVWSQEAYLKGPDNDEFDFFGGSVAISNDTVVVGALFEDSSSSGIDGDWTNNSFTDTGAAYVFAKTGSVWSQQAYLKASNNDLPLTDLFGISVAISNDTVVVGASNEDGSHPNFISDGGAAYVFERAGTIWSQRAYLKASNAGVDDQFGVSVAISDEVLVVGSWQERSDATGVGGDQFSNASPNSGAVYLFDVSPKISVDLCSADGGNGMGCTDCPCTNNSPAGTVGGCLNSAGASARLQATGDLSVSLPAGVTSDLRFALLGAPPSAFCILNSGDGVAPGNMASPCFGLNSGAQAMQFDGLRCAIMNTRRHGGRSADVNGEVGTSSAPWGGEGGPPVGIAVAGGGFAAGQTRYFQAINRDDPLLVCMRGLNTSQAVEVTFTP